MACDFTSFSTVFQPYLGRLADDNERLCPMKPHLWLRRFCLERGLNLGLARSVGQGLSL